MRSALCALLTAAVVLAQQSAPAPAAAQPKAPAKGQVSATVRECSVLQVPQIRSCS